MADDELKKHEDVDDNLANMIAKIRIQTENEMRRYQQESETNYQTTVSFYWYIYDFVYTTYDLFYLD